MKIECILKRQDGTKAEVGGIEYHFEPLADGAHVAEVADTAHIDRFLAIPEGYKVYHGSEEPNGKPVQVGKLATVPVSAPAAPTSAALAGSEVHPPQFEINGKTYTQLEVVQKAFEASGMTSDEWNDLGDDERAAKMDIALDDLADAADGEDDQGGEDAPVDEADARAQLVAQYEAKFGKKPHYRASIEKIKAELGE
jgi:hypothetical protein